jgi:hypothetical protein
VSKSAATKPAATKPAATKPAATKPAATKPAATKPAATKPAATKPAAAPSTAGKTDAAVKPPFPNYEELPIASLRARMRGLDVSQLRDLIKYEKAHAARDDVISMFERRISKIEETAG